MSSRLDVNQSDNPYAAPQNGWQQVAGTDVVLVDGNMNVGKDKGQGQLLLTPKTVYAFRAKSQAGAVGGIVGGVVGGVVVATRGNLLIASAAGAMAGLLGVLILQFINKLYSTQGSPPQFMENVELRDLNESNRRKLERASLLASFPIDSALKVKRTRLGFNFEYGRETSVVYQGLVHKTKVAAFLRTLAIDVQ